MPLCTIEDVAYFPPSLVTKVLVQGNGQSYDELLAVIKDITKDLDPKNREKSANDVNHVQYLIERAERMYSSDSKLS